MRPSHPPPSTPLLDRTFSALALAALGALLAAVPAALRVADSSSVSLVHGLAILAGLAALPVALVGLVARRAYLGWSSFGADESGLRLATFAGWLAWLGLVAVRFGAMLRAKTHHHALAAVTFALALLVFGAALALVSRRILRLLRDLSAGAAETEGTSHETLARLLGFVWVAVPLAGLVFAFRSAAPELEPSARGVVIDGAALLLGSLVASRNLVAPKAVTVGGSVAFVALIVLGFVGLRESPVISTLEATAPLLVRWIPH